MSNENIDTIIYLIFFLIFFFGIFGVAFLAIKIENDYELKKLGIIKPKNVKYESNYSEKLKYQIKSWIITICSILIIFIICKLFGFGISDVINLINQ